MNSKFLNHVDPSDRTKSDFVAATMAMCDDVLDAGEKQTSYYL
jgi:hypothetical protein